MAACVGAVRADGRTRTHAGRTPDARLDIREWLRQALRKATDRDIESIIDMLDDVTLDCLREMASVLTVADFEYDDDDTTETDSMLANTGPNIPTGCCVLSDPHPVLDL